MFSSESKFIRRTPPGLFFPAVPIEKLTIDTGKRDKMMLPKKGYHKNESVSTHRENRDNRGRVPWIDHPRLMNHEKKSKMNQNEEEESRELSDQKRSPSISSNSSSSSSRNEKRHHNNTSIGSFERITATAQILQQLRDSSIEPPESLEPVSYNWRFNYSAPSSIAGSAEKKIGMTQNLPLATTVSRWERKEKIDAVAAATGKVCEVGKENNVMSFKGGVPDTTTVAAQSSLTTDFSSSINLSSGANYPSQFTDTDSPHYSPKCPASLPYHYPTPLDLDGREHKQNEFKENKKIPPFSLSQNKSMQQQMPFSHFNRCQSDTFITPSATTTPQRFDVSGNGTSNIHPNSSSCHLLAPISQDMSGIQITSPLRPPPPPQYSTFSPVATATTSALSKQLSEATPSFAQFSSQILKPTPEDSYEIRTKKRSYTKRGTSTKKQKVCRMDLCNELAAKRTPYCENHSGVRKCEFVGCTKCAQGRTRFCIAHGGGRRCIFPGCTKAARDRKYCAAHGGGKRCEEEGCQKSAVGGSSKCTAHGGGKRCRAEGCNKSAQSKTDYCVKHGGGRRCAVKGCHKVARGKTSLCMSHSSLGEECEKQQANQQAGHQDET